MQSTNEQYGSAAYWEKRYRSGEHEDFEWYFGWRDIKRNGWLTAALELKGNETRILMSGCGNSELSKDMWEAGFHNITNIDISQACIDAMKTKYGHLEGMTWLTMDAAHMDFAANSFDFVLDKGTVDALSCSPQCWAIIRDVNKEVQRVLAPGGVYVVFSYAQPEVRFPHFQRRCFTWDATATTIQLDKNTPYYLYTMKKPLDENARVAEPDDAAVPAGVFLSNPIWRK